MTNKEIINRNIGLTFDFLRQAVKNPSLLSTISDGSTLEFVEKDFSKTERKKTTKSNSRRKYIRVKTEFLPI